MSTELTAAQAQAAPVTAEDLTPSLSPNSVPATPSASSEEERIDAYTSAVLSNAPAATVERLEAEMCGHGPAAPEAKEPDRFRFKDAEDRTIAMIAKSKGISLAAAARLFSGSPEPAEAPPANPGDAAPGASTYSPTVAALENHLAQVRAQIRAQKSEGALPSVALDELEDRRADLVAQLAVARLESRAAQQAQARDEVNDADFARGRGAVLAETVQAYPAMRQTDSPLYLVAKAIAAQMHDPQHPEHSRLLEVDAPRFIAEKAAEKLGVRPADNSASSSRAKRPGPAPGSRQSAAPALQKSEQELLRDSEENLEAVLEGRARAPQRKPRSYAFI